MGVFRENPVLAKEVRTRLRAGRQTRANRVSARVAVLAIVGILYYYGLAALLGANSQSNAEGLYIFFTLGIEVTLALFMVPALAAAAITQEREQQTWNALLLSRLTPGEIVSGKFFAALLPMLVVLGLFFPLKLLAAVAGGVDLPRFVISNLLLVSTITFFTATSLFWSWRCKRTFVATSASFATVMFFVVGTFMLFGLFQVAAPRSGFDPEDFAPMWLNPYMAMWYAIEQRNGNLAIALTCAVVYLLGTVLFTVIVARRLTYGAKELEQ